MNKARYDIYLNIPAAGIVQAAECVIQENNNSLTAVGFRYVPSYLELPEAFSIDPAQLPLKAKEFELSCAGSAPGFIDDYLPDAWGRKVVSQLAQHRDKITINANSVIQLLSYMSNSRIGSLMIVPKGELAVYDRGSLFNEIDKIEALANKVEQANYTDIVLNEMSLLYLANSGTGVGGARPKALVEKDGIAYLAKFNREKNDDYNNARVELACLNMARAAGLNVTTGKIVNEINQRDILLLKRFDINEDNSRNHLISLNTLLKEPGTQRDLGTNFTYELIYQQLQKYSSTIEQDAKQLLRLMLFNRVINNIDDHERNFSLIYKNGGYSLSDAYDLVPSLSKGKYHVAGFNHQPSPPRLDKVTDMGKIFGLSKVEVKNIADQVLAAAKEGYKYAEEAGVNEEEAKAIAGVFNF